MRSYIAGEDITIPVPLVWNGEPFIPDAGNVTWLVRGHSGVVVLPQTTLHGVTDTTAFITLPTSINTLSGDAVEKRTVIASGTVGNDPFVITVPYRIHEFLNTTAQPADVRKLLGIDDGELPDADVDIVEAYFDVAVLTTAANLTAALAGAQVLEHAANKAIVAQAVLNLLPSLAARISKTESDGTSKAERFPLDLEKLEIQARDQRDKAIVTVTGVAPTGRKFATGAVRADPITGA